MPANTDMALEIEDMPTEVFKNMYLHVNKGHACVGYVSENTEGKVVFELYDVGGGGLVELSQEDLLLIIKGMQVMERRLCGR